MRNEDLWKKRKMKNLFAILYSQQNQPNTNLESGFNDNYEVVFFECDNEADAMLFADSRIDIPTQLIGIVEISNPAILAKLGKGDFPNLTIN